MNKKIKKYLDEIAKTEKKIADLQQYLRGCLLYTSTLVVAIGAGLGVWGVINLMEGYGNDNPGANAHVR